MNSKKYDLILFDLDGTLADTVADIAFYANEALVHFDYPTHPVSAVKRSIGWGVHELLKTLEPLLGDDPSRLDQAVELFKKNYRQKPVHETVVFEGVEETLAGPLAHTKKAVVTNKPQDIAEQILKELGLARHFEITIGMNAGFPPKPDPTSIRHVMNLLAVVSERTVYVGDSGIDADAAKNAGVDFAWVSYGYDAPHLIDPVARFSSARQWRLLV